MKIINRYVTTEYLKVLFSSLFTFLMLYFVIDFFERFDMFIKYKAETSVILEYFFYKTPFIFYQVLPVAILLSTLLTIGMLSKNNEITAMKSSGISIYKISVPLIMIALLLTLLSFLFSEYVTPYTNQRVTQIKNSVKNKKTGSFLRHDKMWYAEKRELYNFDYFDAQTNSLHGITIFYYDNNLKLKRRVDAKKAVFRDEKWILSDIVQRDFSNKYGITEITKETEYDEKDIHIAGTPVTLKEVRKKAEEMSYDELKTFVARIKGEGFDASEYEVDMHSKLSIPFVCVIMTIIGIPFALKSERSGSIAVGVGISLIIGFLYWITLSFSLSLGHAAVLPPLIAAWISLVIFLLIGAYMFSTIRQ